MSRELFRMTKYDVLQLLPPTGYQALFWAEKPGYPKDTGPIMLSTEPIDFVGLARVFEQRMERLIDGGSRKVGKPITYSTLVAIQFNKEMGFEVLEDISNCVLVREDWDMHEVAERQWPSLSGRIKPKDICPVS